MKYWEIEFKCDDSWSISGIYSFFMKQETEPNIEDIKRVHGTYPNEDGLGNIVRIIEITEKEYLEENMSSLLEEVIETLECCDIEPTKENIKKQINEYIKNFQSHIGTEAHNHSMECGVENLTGMTWDEMDKVMLQQIEEYKSCLKELE